MKKIFKNNYFIILILIIYFIIFSSYTVSKYLSIINSKDIAIPVINITIDESETKLLLNA